MAKTNSNFITKAFDIRETIKQSRESDGRSEFIGSVFFTIISLALTLMNVFKHAASYMTLATTILTLGFIVATILALCKQIRATHAIIMILCAAIFTLFAVSGGNDGFAILWILLVPLLGAMWIGLTLGVVMGLYFLVLLVVLFYTPLKAYVQDYYSATFMLRFPLLYAATFGANTFLMWQREKLVKLLTFGSYHDGLTGLKNRRAYNEELAKLDSENPDEDFACLSFDVNNLKFHNDTYGHDAGDEQIKAAAELIQKCFGKHQCFRTGGDEFMVLGRKIDIEKTVADFKQEVGIWKGKLTTSLSVSVGWADAKSHPDMNLSELLIHADDKMYADKEEQHQKGSVCGR